MPPASSRRSRVPRIALILPACHEEETIQTVLDELLSTLGPEAEWIVGVGVNGSPEGQDQTAALARTHPLQPVVAETIRRGYGFGCQVVIERIERLLPAPDAYLFFAADGANDPNALVELVREFQCGTDFVLGCRTSQSVVGANQAVMGWPHILANRLLGAWCGVLTGCWFRDIDPLRLIRRDLFHRLHLREWTFGWTIEAQVTAARLGASMIELPVRERPRLAGQQKVSKVSGRQTISIGWQILRAGWRTRQRALQGFGADTLAARQSAVSR